MFSNYIKIALRTLYNNKGFSAINIAGLALGLACSLLILLWVQDEKSMDAFHANNDRLYRVFNRLYFDGRVTGQYNTPAILARELKKEVPDIEMASSYENISEHTFSVGDKLLKVKGGAADSDFFRMFSYHLLEGRASEALLSMESITISRSMADNFYGSPQAAMGKTLRYDNRKDFIITAVFEDLSAHSSEPFDFLVSWNFYMADNPYLDYWGNNNAETNILLYPHVQPALVDHKIDHFIDTHLLEQEGTLIPGFHEEISLQSFPSLYLHSHSTNGKIDGGRIEYVQLFSLVALFILVIACINFMNLSTARSVKRAKEIGVRKVLGAVRGLLIRQFMGEAAIIALISGIAAVLLVIVVLPSFNELTGKQIALHFGDGSLWTIVTLLIVLTGILSGIYPALVLSGYNPIQILKSHTIRTDHSAVWLRKGLVVFQFMLSIILIISTLLVSSQIRFVESANLGYDRENLIYIPIEGDLSAKADLFKQEALHLPGISMISDARQSPTQLDNFTINVKWPGQDPNDKPLFAQLAVGYDFIKTFSAKMVQGRDFSTDFATDSNAYIVNEAAMKKIGFDHPIGQHLTLWGKTGTVIGVANDFHFQSLRDAIRPIILHLQAKDKSGLFLVRTQPGQTHQALVGLEKLCKELNPHFPFTYTFSSEEYTKLYKSEALVGRLSIIFAFLAILISCLGLFGLSIFNAVQRTKEIGIRKVLGADMISLFQLLAKEFLILVVAAFVIASPLAWWAMHKWLEQFAYRTSPSWWIFGLSGSAAILIAFVTVCFQTIRIARANPIKSLRTE